MRHLATILVLVLAWAEGAAQSASEARTWSLTPYLWLPTIDGHLKHELPPGGDGAPEVSIGPTDWLELLNFGALVGATATRERFIVFTDLIYLSMSSDNDGRLVSAESVLSGPRGATSIPVGADLNIETGSELDGLDAVGRLCVR